MLKFLQCRCISSGPSFSVRKFTLISPARKEEENSNLYHLYIYIYFYINISGFPSLFPFHSDTNSTKENVNFFTMEETFPLGLILIDSPHLHTIPMRASVKKATRTPKQKATRNNKNDRRVLQLRLESERATKLGNVTEFCERKDECVILGAQRG